MDFERAYDSVRREILCIILIGFGIPMKLIRLIKMCLIETYSTVRIDKNLSDVSPVWNGLKQGDALSPFSYMSALEYAIRRVQVNQNGLKLNGAHQLLVYADDVTVFGVSVHTIKKNAEALVVASKESRLEVNGDKTKYEYIVMSRDPDAGRSHSVEIVNNSFERSEEFRCLGITITNRNSIQEEIKNRLKSGNACYHSVQNLFPSRLLSKNLKIKIYSNYNFVCCFVWV